jgi:hypothetical protein
MTLFELFAATAMITLTVVLIAWFYREKTAASVWRRTRMLNRLGLSPDIGEHGRFRTRALMKRARRRCNRCPSEALCERWLAGEDSGDHLFCPNAHTFETVRQHERLAV